MFMKWCIRNFRLYLVLYLIINLITILVSGLHIDFTHILAVLGLSSIAFLGSKFINNTITMKSTGNFLLMNVIVAGCFCFQFTSHNTGTTVAVFMVSSYCVTWLVSIKILKIKYEDDISDEQELF